MGNDVVSEDRGVEIPDLELQWVSLWKKSKMKGIWVRGDYSLVESHLEIGHNHHLAILLARPGNGAIFITIPNPSCRGERTQALELSQPTSVAVRCITPARRP